MAERDIVLSVRDVWKRFGGLVALGGVSLQVARGEIVGLIGPNGAGKTTLFNVIAGAYRADRGSIVFGKRDISSLRAHDLCRLGIARTFQITKPFGKMTVLDNVAVAAYYGKPRPSAGVSLQRCRERAMETLEFAGLAHKAYALAQSLNISERKKLELCRAVGTGPELLLLDEVVAGLNPTEVDDMVDLIRRINASGVTILMIEHVMKAVMGVSHRVIVLNLGKKLAEGTPAEVSANEDVIAAYLGGLPHA